MNIGLITAAGIGLRMNNGVPKQFLHVKNKPLIVHTLAQFQKHPSIDHILIVTLPAWINVLEAYSKDYNITKLTWIVAGGNTGQESIRNGLQTLKNEGLKDEDTVLIHDGNRCNISPELISNSLSIFAEFGCAVAAIPCTEAVFQSDDNGRSSSKSIPREELYRTQTPHTYSLGKLLWAHEMAAKMKITNTAATCTLMQMLGEKIYFSKGSETNLKITTQEDLSIFKSLQKAKKK